MENVWPVRTCLPPNSFSRQTTDGQTTRMEANFGRERERRERLQLGNNKVTMTQYNRPEDFLFLRWLLFKSAEKKRPQNVEKKEIVRRNIRSIESSDGITNWYQKPFSLYAYMNVFCIALFLHFFVLLVSTDFHFFSSVRCHASDGQTQPGRVPNGGYWKVLSTGSPARHLQVEHLVLLLFNRHPMRVYMGPTVTVQ